MTDELDNYLQKLPIEQLKKLERKLSSPDPLDKMITDLTAVIGNYDPNIGWVRGKWRARKSGARVELIASLSQEVNYYVDCVRKLEEAKLMKLASSKGLTFEMLQAATLMQLEIDKEITIARELSRIRVEEAESLGKLEIEKLWQEAEQDLKAGFIYQNEAQEQLHLLREYINGRYKEAELLKASREPGAQRQLNLLEEHIIVMEGLFRERQKGLLQTTPQKDAQGSNEDTDLR